MEWKVSISDGVCCSYLSPQASDSQFAPRGASLWLIMPHVFNYEKKEFEQVHYNKVQWKCNVYHATWVCLLFLRFLLLWVWLQVCSIVAHCSFKEVVLIEAAGVHQCRCPSVLPRHSVCNRKCEDVWNNNYIQLLLDYYLSWVCLGRIDNQ